MEMLDRRQRSIGVQAECMLNCPVRVQK